MVLQVTFRICNFRRYEFLWSSNVGSLFSSSTWGTIKHRLMTALFLRMTSAHLFLIWLLFLIFSPLCALSELSLSLEHELEEDELHELDESDWTPTSPSDLVLSAISTSSGRCLWNGFNKNRVTLTTALYHLRNYHCVEALSFFKAMDAQIMQF